MAAGTRCEHPFFHIQVRNPDSEFLTRDQWLIVVDRIERILGLSCQPRAIAFHRDWRTGGEHMHLAFSRIDHETLTARKLPFFKLRLNTVSRELEAELGLTPVRSNRASVIKYAPLRPQEEQARRLSVDIREVLETVRECFDTSDCGHSFAAALANNELTLARANDVILSSSTTPEEFTRLGREFSDGRRRRYGRDCPIWPAKAFRRSSTFGNG